MTSLATAGRGRWRIVEVLRPAARRRMMGLGVFAGDTVEIVKTGPGPVIFLKGATRIAVGCGMAQAVLVEPDGADAPPER